MTEWSVAVTSAIPAGVEDLDDAVGRVLDAAYDHAPAASYSADSLTLRVALRAGDVQEASTSGLRVCTDALASVDWPADVRDLHVTEWSLFEAGLEGSTYPEVVGITEIAALLGTSRQRASELARSARFPAPLADLAAGPIWPKPAVDRFVEEWDRRPGRPRSKSLPGGGEVHVSKDGEATA